MLFRLRHPTFVGRDREHHRRRGTETGKHVRDESLVPGHVDERDLRPARQGRPREPEINRQPPPALLRPAIGLHAGERAHQRRLAVVDVTRGRDDVHQAVSTAFSTSASCSGGTQRRSSRHLSRSTRATTQGSPRRRRSAYDGSSATAQPGNVTPGAPPPPTTPSDGTTSASMPPAVSSLT